jgi:hypothetical protein
VYIDADADDVRAQEFGGPALEIGRRDGQHVNPCAQAFQPVAQELQPDEGDSAQLVFDARREVDQPDLRGGRRMPATGVSPTVQQCPGPLRRRAGPVPIADFVGRDREIGHALHGLKKREQPVVLRVVGDAGQHHRRGARLLPEG